MPDNLYLKFHGHWSSMEFTLDVIRIESFRKLDKILPFSSFDCHKGKLLKNPFHETDHKRKSKWTFSDLDFNKTIYLY